MSLLRSMTLLCLAAFFGLATGCGDGTGNGVSPLVAARVNNGELAVRDVRAFLGDADDPDGEMGGLVLERLIGRELLVQQAQRRHLDRDPEVARLIEASRREILVRAYIEREFGDLSPTAEEIESFYDGNPQLFSERNVYTLRELAVRMPSDRFEALQDVVSSAGNLDEVGEWVRDQGYRTEVTEAARAAEQLPRESLADLGRMQRGQIAVGQSSAGAIVVELVGVERLPLGREEARPMIEAYLFNQNMSDAIAREVARLRASARIVYAEAFDPSRRSGASNASAETLYQQNVHIEEGAMRSALERGVAGLK